MSRFTQPGSTSPDISPIREEMAQDIGWIRTIHGPKASPALCAPLSLPATIHSALIVHALGLLTVLASVENVLWIQGTSQIE